MHEVTQNNREGFGLMESRLPFLVFACVSLAALVGLIIANGDVPKLVLAGVLGAILCQSIIKLWVPNCIIRCDNGCLVYRSYRSGMIGAMRLDHVRDVNVCVKFETGTEGIAKNVYLEVRSKYDNENVLILLPRVANSPEIMVQEIRRLIATGNSLAHSPDGVKSGTGTGVKNPSGHTNS